MIIENDCYFNISNELNSNKWTILNSNTIKIDPSRQLLQNTKPADLKLWIVNVNES